MSSTLVLKPLWDNGHCSYLATFVKMSADERIDVELLAVKAGFDCSDGIWKPIGSKRDFVKLRNLLSALGHALKFDDPDDGPFNLQRLHLTTSTRLALETLAELDLYDLSGWCPVQAEGTIDGKHFYFRARGSYWRLEIGGNEPGTRSPRWWHEETWPSVTGFEAGYMSDEEAIGCILKAIDMFRHGDNTRFMPGDPGYERTVLEGWSAGAISLRIAAIRLGLSGEEVVLLTEKLGVELPYTAKWEVAGIGTKPIRRLKRPQK